MSDEMQAKHFVIHDGTSIHVLQADWLCWADRTIQTIQLGRGGPPGGSMVAEFGSFNWWRVYDTLDEAMRAARQADQPLEIVGAP